MSGGPPGFGSAIIALGRYQPPHVVTNDDLAHRLDTSDEWIQSRVGIRTRHIATNETIVDMATAAAAKAVAGAGLSASDLDLLVVATSTNLTRQSAARQTAARLGARNALSLDVNAVCSGFCHALATADQAIRAGAAEVSLVVGVDKYSGVMDWTDRTTAVIFADGAGAALLTRSDQPQIGPVRWGSDPSKGDAIVMTNQPASLVMQGQQVYRWTTNFLPQRALEACVAAGVNPSDLGGFVPHQANLRIINAMAARIGLGSQTVISRDITSSGNTGAASIPIALSKVVERREIAPGAPVLLLGFGGGLNWASQVIRCP